MVGNKEMSYSSKDFYEQRWDKPSCNIYKFKFLSVNILALFQGCKYKIQVNSKYRDYFQNLEVA